MEAYFNKDEKSRFVRGYGATMISAAASLAGAVAIYSVCLLMGEPVYGYAEPAYVLARRSIRLALALIIALVLGLALKQGLSVGGKGWQKAAAWVLLAAPPVVSVIFYVASNERLLFSAPIWWAELALWPVLAAMLAQAFLNDARHLGRGTAAYCAACLTLIVLSVCVERYQHDYIEFICMAITAIAVWFVVAGGTKRFGGHGRAMLVLLAVAFGACWLALVADWRFWDILSEPSYAGVWVSDRLESVQRFLTVGGLSGWDVPPEHNALFLVASVGGPIAAIAYVALSLASLVSMTYACSKLARRMRETADALLALAVVALGAAYAACVVLGLAAELFNITTTVGLVQGLGAAPAAMLLVAALLGSRPIEVKEIHSTHKIQPDGNRHENCGPRYEAQIIWKSKL